MEALRLESMYRWTSVGEVVKTARDFLQEPTLAYLGWPSTAGSGFQGNSHIGV